VPSLTLVQVGHGIEPEAMAALIEETNNFKLVMAVAQGNLVFFTGVKR